MIINDNENDVCKSRESFTTKFISQSSADELSSTQIVNLKLTSTTNVNPPRSTTDTLNKMYSNDKEILSLVKNPKFVEGITTKNDCKTRQSTSKAANTGRKRGRRLDRAHGKQIIRDIMTNELTQRDKSLIRRAFALGIKKFIQDEKFHPTKKSKYQRSRKSQLWSQIMKGFPKVTESDLQWNFTFPRIELEQHPFHDIAMKF